VSQAIVAGGSCQSDLHYGRIRMLELDPSWTPRSFSRTKLALIYKFAGHTCASDRSNPYKPHAPVAFFFSLTPFAMQNTANDTHVVAYTSPQGPRVEVAVRTAGPFTLTITSTRVPRRRARGELAYAEALADEEPPIPIPPPRMIQASTVAPDDTSLDGHAAVEYVKEEPTDAHIDRRREADSPQIEMNKQPESTSTGSGALNGVEMSHWEAIVDRELRAAGEI